MHPALSKILSDVVQFLKSQNIALDPPEKDPDRRRGQRTAGRVMKGVTELDSGLTVYQDARVILLNKAAASSNQGQALVEAVQEAGIGIDTAKAMFAKLKKFGANDNAILAAVDAVAATLEKKCDPEESVAVPKVPAPGPLAPPNPGAPLGEKPPAKGEAKSAVTPLGERSAKGKA